MQTGANNAEDAKENVLKNYGDKHKNTNLRKNQSGRKMPLDSS